MGLRIVNATIAAKAYYVVGVSISCLLDLALQGSEKVLQTISRIPAGSMSKNPIEIILLSSCRRCTRDDNNTVLVIASVDRNG